MSIYKNGKLIAGGRQCMPLLSFMWADHTLNDASWLRADTFSWQSGAVYQAAYQHLVDDYNNIPTEPTVYVNHTSSPTGYFYRDSYFDVSGATHPYAYVRYNNDGSMLVLYANHTTGESSDYYYENADGSGPYYFGGFSSGTFYMRPIKHETINGTVISFYEAQDGHKIAPERTLLDISNNRPMLQSTNVASIYNDTGVAWYYILDTTNQRFKLPRTQFGFTGIRSDVGAFVEAGLPSFSATFNVCDTNGYVSASGDITLTNYQKGAYGGGGGRANSEATATLKPSNSIYGNSNTVQPKATEMYLYFYVGNFTQTALENTAGITAETLNDKVDKGHQVIEFQEPTAGNNYTWYRKYADGWVEQGGLTATTTHTTINLPVEMANTNYSIVATSYKADAGSSNASNNGLTVGQRTTTSFFIVLQEQRAYFWQVSGMAA